MAPRHYVIVRSDLPFGIQLAQTIHAAGESSPGNLPPHTFAVALHAKNEAHLQEIAARLVRGEIPFVAIHESDPPYSGQLMAIGISPYVDPRQFTSDLPLARGISSV